MEPEDDDPRYRFEFLPPALRADAIAQVKREEADALRYRQRCRRRKIVMVVAGAVVALAMGIFVAASWWYLALLVAAGGGAAFGIDALRLEHLGGMCLYGMTGIVLTAVGLYIGAVQCNPLVFFSVWIIYIVSGGLLGVQSMQAQEG